MDEAPVSGIPPLAGAPRELVDGRVIVSLAGEGLRELIVGRRGNRVERKLLRELGGRVCRATRARQEPNQLIREMAGRGVQRAGPTRLAPGLLVKKRGGKQKPPHT